ncbi:MAG: uroporphyrinogen decarboxylase family protein [Acidobacteriia bacterium]|nr:uroporphyrinogen decarboxylase family protein [Terriglobia bacterium]
MTGRERVLAAIEGRATDHLALMPITMMFAADVAGVHYREYATNCHAMADAQVRTAEKFGFDYVSGISDPAREASDLGAAIEWFDDQPPAIIESRALLHDKSTLLKVQAPDPSKGRMGDRVKAIELLAAQVGSEKIVEGWVEGPCAMAADLRGLNTLMLDFFDDPAFVADLFEFVTGMELHFAQAQVNAGASLIGVGDAAASLIGPKLYQQYVFPYERRLIQGIQALGVKVRLHICGSTRKLFSDMGKLGADIVDLDWMAPLGEAREVMGPTQVLLGNIDPVRVLREGDADSVERAIGDCHRAAGERYIVGAGCEVPRGTPHENVRAMARYAQEHR